MTLSLQFSAGGKYPAPPSRVEGLGVEGSAFEGFGFRV